MCKDLAEATTYKQEPERKYSATDKENVPVVLGHVKRVDIASGKQDSKEIKQRSDLKNNWRQVQSDVAQMRQTLDEEKLARNIKKQELKQKETVLIDALQNTLCEEQQARTRVEEGLSQARTACNDLELANGRLRNEIAQTRQTLDNETSLRNTREQELRERKTVVDALLKTLGEEQQARNRTGEELRRSRTRYNELKGRLENEIAQMRQTCDNATSLCNAREQELRERETVIGELQETLGKEQQVRARVEEELKQAGTRYDELKRRLENDIVQIRQVLVNQLRLSNRKTQELKEKETILNSLQKTLGEVQRAKTRATEELNQARSICSELEERLQNEMLSKETLREELEVKETVIREQQLELEEERQQNTALEERLSSLQLEMVEERNSRDTTERELQLALSAAREALAEYQRRQPRDWIIQREEVVLSENVLGRGAWGNVCEGTFRSCQVAVKEIHELILSDHNRRLFEREMRIASCCRHPNLLQFIGATNDDDSPLFVTELLDTSLRHVLSQRALNQEEIVRLALDVAKGLNYLHLNKPLPIIHRDISSGNVLLWRRDERWRAKLSDYGSANFMLQVMTVNPGAIIYSAPEAFTSQQSPKVKSIVSQKIIQSRRKIELVLLPEFVVD